MTACPRTIRIAQHEMQILRLLWQHGPASVRALHRHLANLAYTTVLTICVRLVEKGVLERQRAPSDPSVEDLVWYRVRVLQLAADCNARRAPAGTEGWATAM